MLTVEIGKALDEIAVISILLGIIPDMPRSFVHHGAKATLGRQSIDVPEVGLNFLAVGFWEGNDRLLNCIDLTFLGSVEIDCSEECARSKVLLQQMVWRLPQEAAEHVVAAHERGPAVESSANVPMRKYRGTLFVKPAMLALQDDDAT
ncbi:MAG: hypothetical protein ACM31O_17010 [Bacteroidota bacterium]